MNPIPITITAPGYLPQTISLQPLPPAPTIPQITISPCAIRLKGQAGPTPAQAWLGGFIRDVNGFILFPAYSTVYYIDAINGNDANAGTSAALAFATDFAALKKLVPGQTAAVLYCRGQTHRTRAVWQGGGPMSSGAPSGAPLLIADYGPIASPLPKLISNGGGNGHTLSFATINNVALNNLDLTGPLADGCNLLHWAGQGSYFLASNCRFADNNTDGIAVQALTGPISQVVFDNCIVADNFDPTVTGGGKAGSGLYIYGAQDVILNGGLLSGNGGAIGSNILSHNLYFHCQDTPSPKDSPPIITNLFSIAPAHYHFKAETGANMQGVVCWNGVCGEIGRIGGLIDRCIFGGAGSQSLELRGCQDVTVSNNLFLDNPNGGGECIAPDDRDVITTVAVPGSYSASGNINMRWVKPGFDAPIYPPGTGVTFSIGKNDFNGTGLYADNTRNLLKYAASIGFATVQAFLNAAKNNMGGGPSFNPALTANGALNWICAGYQLAPVPLAAA